MFKSNPLTEEFQLYRRKNAQTLQVKPFSIKSNPKNYKKSYLQKNHHLSEVRKSNLKNTRYDQLKTINQNLSAVIERNLGISEDKKQKCKFKIHNAVKNDNYLQKDQILTVDQQKQRTEIKGLSVKNSVLNPETEKPNKIIQEPIYSRHRSRNTSRLAKANIGHINIGESANAKEPVQNKPINMNSQMRNQLKSTLYQSIDLGNLFEKIQSNIDQSQKMTSSQLYSNQEPFAPDFTNTVTKKTQIRRIQVNRHELKDPVSQNKLKMNKFNLKNLIDKNGSATNSPIPQKLLDKSFFESLSARTQHTDKQKGNLPHQIHGIDEKRQQSWMPTKRKRSIAIVMDDNGVIKEESSGMGQNQIDSLRMSMKISNLRQMMKGDQLDFI